MPKHVYLIDYENIQNIDLTPLLKQDVLIKVFCSGHQKYSNTFFDLALEFGKEKIERIEIVGSGKNAADFHIAYYIGKLSKELNAPHFHIISKDGGFKNLNTYLNEKEKISCSLEPKIAAIIQTPKATAKTAKDNYQRVLDHLTKAPGGKPKKMDALRHQINNLTGKKIGEAEVEKIIERLKANRVIECENGTVSYGKM